MLQFEQPFLLLLLIPISFLVYLTWKGIALSYPTFQHRLILICRISLFTLIILALAGTTWVLPVSHQATVFVGDISASTGPQRTFIEQWINNAIKHKHPDDQVGIVAVGHNALVEQSVKSQIDFAHFESSPDTNYTDLAAGLRLAAAILPTDSQRHIVLLTDGQQNLEDAMQEAQLLQQEGIRLDIVPLPNSSGPEARIDDLQAPTSLHTDEHFVLHIKLDSSVAQKATLRIYLDNSLLSEQSIQLTVGQQDFSVTMLAPSSGFHTLRVTLQAPYDALIQNNEASAFVNVQGPPTVLVIEGQPSSGQNIVSALQATGMQVETGAPESVPVSLDSLAKYSAVVLADVPAALLGNTRMQLLQSFVRDLGHGLIVSGGQNSYSLGSYANTPLEQALPVRMDSPQHKETPSIAVVLIIESLEADIPINISKEAAKGVIGLLTSRDMVGISGGYGTLSIPMQTVQNRSKIDKAIDNLNPTDPSSYVPDLLNAAHILKSLHTQIKHIILLGDGDAYDSTYASVVPKIAEEGITVSTVATNAQLPQDFATMQQIASSGKGRYYQADNPTAIPQILLQETEYAARRSVINQTFNPAIVGNHPILTGLNDFPQLHGYIATTPKPTGQVVLISPLDDPVLAVWQYGLGRVVAWTSDALGLWTKDWLTWKNAARWWANLVTWILPAPSDSALTINGKFINGMGQLTANLNAAVPVGATQQQLQVHIVGPPPDNALQTITLQPIAPERWAGSFAASQVGPYLLQATWQASANGASGMISKLSTQTGLIVPYSPEYRTQGTDLRFLKLLARAGGGAVLDANNVATAFTQNLPSTSASIPITFWLLTLAALLLPIDIAVRRLTSLGCLTEGYQWILAHLKIGNLAQIATSAGDLSVDTTATVLDRLRTQRQDRHRPQSNQANKRPIGNFQSQLGNRKDNSVKEPKPTQADRSDLSMVARLVEAKRKRQQKSK
jgi:uncharacterized membrane protein